ncbi:MAG: 23S rRNA (adenine(2030)-N(6))-methyltransferase RlmJ [Treponema sp.]|nr:23S rRNA (adenine(2030)-N(6))-methyltransferase RlmJ [Treponema sp.]
MQAQEGVAPNSRLATDTGSKPHTQILKADGLKTLLAQTPPKIKRGAVLIDPSYEEAGEYEAVSKTVVAVHKKWSAGIIMIWYPLLAHRSEEIERMIAAICAAAKNQNANTNILRAEFCVDTPQSHTEMSLEENSAAKAATPSTAPRLYGSGILVINAPWKLDEELDAALKYLSRVPGLATEPSYSITKS